MKKNIGQKLALYPTPANLQVSAYWRYHWWLREDGQGVWRNFEIKHYYEEVSLDAYDFLGKSVIPFATSGAAVSRKPAKTWKPLILISIGKKASYGTTYRKMTWRSGWRITSSNFHHRQASHAIPNSSIAVKSAMRSSISPIPDSIVLPETPPSHHLGVNHIVHITLSHAIKALQRKNNKSQNLFHRV